jgi:hypothetical protein
MNARSTATSDEAPFNTYNEVKFNKDIVTHLFKACVNTAKKKMNSLTQSSVQEIDVKEQSSMSDIEVDDCIEAIEIAEEQERFKLAYNELDEVYDECSEKDWDGYGAEAITAKAYNEAKIILNIIPTSYPEPEITPEPGGGIGIEWYKGEGESFIISVDGSKVMVYAGLFGKNNETYGNESFRNTIPRVIFEFLDRLYPGVG